MSLLRRSLELGLGALLLTKEAAEGLLDNLGGDDQASHEQRERAEELAARARRFLDELAESVRGEVERAIARAGMVRRDEYDALAARVRALEQRLGGGEAPAFEPAPEL